MRLLACPPGPSFPLCVCPPTPPPLSLLLFHLLHNACAGKKKKEEERFHLLLCRHFLRKQGGGRPCAQCDEKFPNTEFRSKSSFSFKGQFAPHFAGHPVALGIEFRDNDCWCTYTRTGFAGPGCGGGGGGLYQAHEDQLKISFPPSPFLLPLV